ncbi:hypothetical protein CAPTEDRAFT_225802, partial [Capitella teleta]
LFFCYVTFLRRGHRILVFGGYPLSRVVENDARKPCQPWNYGGINPQGSQEAPFADPSSLLCASWHGLGGRLHSTPCDQKPRLLFCSINRGANPYPWQKLGVNGQYKFWSETIDYKALKAPAERPDID